MQGKKRAQSVIQKLNMKDSLKEYWENSPIPPVEDEYEEENDEEDNSEVKCEDKSKDTEKEIHDAQFEEIKYRREARS